MRCTSSTRECGLKRKEPIIESELVNAEPEQLETRFISTIVRTSRRTTITPKLPNELVLLRWLVDSGTIRATQLVKGIVDFLSNYTVYKCYLTYRNNLNGIYGRGKGAKGIWWGTFGNLTVQNTSPLKSVQMMIRN